MAFTPLTISRPLRFELTEKFCLDNNIHPFRYGDTFSFRFQLRDYDDAAVSLSGASIVAVFSRLGTDITRSTATLISGSTYEIKIDTDQSTETGNTGKGWYQLNFLAAENDFDGFHTEGETQRADFYIRVTLGDGSVFTHIKGIVDIL